MVFKKNVPAALLAGLILLVFSCKKDHRPGTPGELNISNIVDSGATVSWDNVQGATGYSVFVATDTNFQRLAVSYAPAVVTQPTIVLNTLTPFTKYFVKVIATVGSDSGGGAKGVFTTSDADDLLFIGSDDYNTAASGPAAEAISNRLYAIHARDGSVAWTYNTSWSISGSPILQGDSVYFAGQDGYVYSLDLQGTLNWKFGPSFSGAGYESAPLIKNGVVYIGDDGGWLYALDATHGGYKWPTAAYSFTKVNSSVIINDSATTLYVSSQDGRVYAVDAATGTIKWRTVNTGNPIVARPVLSNGVLYAGCFFRVYAFDAYTGATKWSTSNPANVQFYSSPVVSNNKILIGGEDGNFYSINAADGSLNWMKNLGSSIESSPTVKNGTIYVGSTTNVYALDEASGNVVWENNNLGINGVIYSGPTVTDDFVYAGTVFGTLYCLNRSTGATVWASSPSGAGFMSSPCIRKYSGRVFYPGVSGMGFGTANP